MNLDQAVQGLTEKHKVNLMVVRAIISNATIVLAICSDARRHNEPKVKLMAVISEYTNRWLMLADLLKVEPRTMAELVTDCTTAASELLLQSGDEAGEEMKLYNLYKELKI